MSHSQHTSFVDSTVRLKWELTKEKFDSCESDGYSYIDSDNFIVQLGTETSEWSLTIYPKGFAGDEEHVEVLIQLMKGDKNYDVLFGFGVETDSGHWPDGDLVEKLYSNKMVNENIDSKEYRHTFWLPESYYYGIDYFSTTEEFSTKFVQNKITFVATLVFHLEGDRYLLQKEVAVDFVKEIRSLSLHENLSDVTIICSGKQFPSYIVLLAARSKYFKALFRNEQDKKEIKIDEASPDIVEALLDFVAKGLIPSDIDNKAVDLLELADMYQIELLSEVCLNSMVDNLAPDNALHTLVTVDKLEHLSNTEQREKILKFVTKEKTKIVASENWKSFIVRYPDLVTEIVLSF